MKIVYKVGVLLGIVMLLAGCTAPGGQGRGGGLSASVLRVGISPDYPPLAFKQDGRLAGVEVDLAHLLGKDLNKRIEYVEMPFGDLIPALRGNRIDIIMSGMSVTEERKRQVAFVKPYLRVGQMALIRMEDVGQLASPLALYSTPLRVGFVAGTTGAAFVQSRMGKARHVPLMDAEQGVDALRKHSIDVFIHDAPTVWRVGNAPGERQLMGLFWPLTEESLAWAVRSTDHALLQRLDDLVAQWKENGTIGAIINRWMRVRVEIK